VMGLNRYFPNELLNDDFVNYFTHIVDLTL
jgi:hypothetical protein